MNYSIYYSIKHNRLIHLVFISTSLLDSTLFDRLSESVSTVNLGMGNGASFSTLVSENKISFCETISISWSTLGQYWTIIGPIMVKYWEFINKKFQYWANNHPILDKSSQCKTPHKHTRKLFFRLIRNYVFCFSLLLFSLAHQNSFEWRVRMKDVEYGDRAVVQPFRQEKALQWNIALSFTKKRM